MPEQQLSPITDPATLAAFSFLARYGGDTRYGYRLDLNSYFGWCQQNGLAVLEAKRVHLELYVRWLEEIRGLKPSTVCRMIGTVSGFYKFASIDDIITKNPAEYVRRPKVSDESTRLGLDRSELGAFIATARASSPTDHVLAVLMGLTGLRVSEACDVRIEHLSYERGHRTLLVDGKGGKISTMPLPPQVSRAVDACVAGRDIGPLTFTRTGAPMNRAAATRIVKRIAKRAGILKNISPHSLRHSYVTACLDAGVHIRDVQIGARHADPRTTMRYDRARHNLDRHANHIVAAFIAGAA